MAFFKPINYELLEQQKTKGKKQNANATPSGYNFLNDELRVNPMGSVYIVEAREQKDKVSSKKIKRLITVRR